MVNFYTTQNTECKPHTCVRDEYTHTHAHTHTHTQNTTTHLPGTFIQVML